MKCRLSVISLCGACNYVGASRLQVMHKAPLLESKQIEHVINERKIVEEAQHPFCVRLCGAYQDRNSLYLLQVRICAGERGLGAGGWDPDLSAATPPYPSQA